MKPLRKSVSRLYEHVEPLILPAAVVSLVVMVSSVITHVPAYVMGAFAVFWLILLAMNMTYQSEMFRQ